MLFPILPFTTLQDTPLVHSTFAKGEDGWIAVQPQGAGAKVAAVHEATNLKVGEGSLNLTYTIGQGQMAGAALPVAEGAAAKMTALHFWVRSEANAPLSITLQEKGGGQYVGMVTAPKGKWQEVEMGIQDFVLSTDPGAAPDPDGKLDPEKIESISIFDLGQFVAQVPPVASLLGLKNGTRSILLSDFQLTAKPLPDPSPTTAAEYVFDTYAHPQPDWSVLNANGSILEAAPFFARALRMDYNLSSGEAAAAFKRLKPGTLIGKKTLNLRLASSHACQLVVQFEETTGGKYNAILKLPASPDPTDQTVDIATLTPDPETKDTNGKLDLDQVKQITLVDITAIAEAPGMNVLWIGKISAKS